MYTDEIAEKIKAGKVGVLPTDTVYGLVCSALDKNAIERIYEIKGRDKTKPPVFLIGDVNQLSLLGVEVSRELVEVVKDYWPGPISIILDCDKESEHLHRGLNSVAVRLPNDINLQNFLIKTGPLATTSVNLSGQEVATDILKAKAYFNNEPKVEFYSDGGELSGKASKIIKIKDGEVEVIRA